MDFFSPNVLLDETPPLIVGGDAIAGGAAAEDGAAAVADPEDAVAADDVVDGSADIRSINVVPDESCNQVIAITTIRLKLSKVDGIYESGSWGNNYNYRHDLWLVGGLIWFDLIWETNYFWENELPRQVFEEVLMPLL